MEIVRENTFPAQEEVSFYLLYFLNYHYNNTNNALATKEAYELLARKFGLSNNERKKVMESDDRKRNHWENWVQQSKRPLARNGLVISPQKGYWLITEKGIDLISNLKVIK